MGQLPVGCISFPKRGDLRTVKYLTSPKCIQLLSPRINLQRILWTLLSGRNWKLDCCPRSLEFLTKPSQHIPPELIRSYAVLHIYYAIGCLLKFWLLTRWMYVTWYEALYKIHRANHYISFFNKVGIGDDGWCVFYEQFGFRHFTWSEIYPMKISPKLYKCTHLSGLMVVNHMKKKGWTNSSQVFGDEVLMLPLDAHPMRILFSFFPIRAILLPLYDWHWLIY